jgi:hypothetical protein
MPGLTVADYDVAPPGRRTVNTEPLPGTLATITSPPIMRASSRVMAAPMDAPKLRGTKEEHKRVSPTGAKMMAVKATWHVKQGGGCSQ